MSTPTGRDFVTIVRKKGRVYGRRGNAPQTDAELDREQAGRIENLQRRPDEGEKDFIDRINRFIEAAARDFGLQPHPIMKRGD